MSTRVPYGKDRSVTAILLLAAAADLDLPASVVQTSPMRGEFVVPDEVAKQVEAQQKKANAEEKKTTEAKKAPAKKSAKKAAPKKSAEPKTATDKKVE